MIFEREILSWGCRGGRDLHLCRICASWSMVDSFNLRLPRFGKQSHAGSREAALFRAEITDPQQKGSQASVDSYCTYCTLNSKTSVPRCSWDPSPPAACLGLWGSGARQLWALRWFSGFSALGSWGSDSGYRFHGPGPGATSTSNFNDGSCFLSESAGIRC